MQVPAPGEPRTLNDFVLRRNTAVEDSGRPVSLVIDCVTGDTRALGGEISDIDGNTNEGTEQWKVSVFDGSGTPLASQTSPLGDDFDLDGEAWAWSFAGLSAPAKRVRIDFTGCKESGIGLAFDSFSVDRAIVPAPATLLLLDTGLIAVGAFARRRS